MPNFTPFETKEQLDRYFSDDRLVCFECGKDFIHLGKHVSMKHHMTADEYRDKWGIPRSRGLAGFSYREFHRDKINNLYESGILCVDKDKLQEYVKSVDHSKKAPMKPASLKAANDNNPYRVHYSAPVKRNKNGRNLQRSSEYKRAYSAKRFKNDDSLMKAYRKKYGKRF